MATERPLAYPPPQGGEPSAFIVPLAPRATTMNTSTRFIEIDYNGNILVSAVTSMNFTGPGVIVSNVGSAVTINIPGSNGTPTGPNNSLQFNSTGTLAGAANLTFNPATSILSVIGNVEAGYFAGDATRLFNIQGANIVGQIPFAAASNTANTALVAVTAGTVTTAAQPAITSVGTLTSVAVTGNVSAAGNITGGNITTTGLVSATGNIRGGNITTPGLVVATGNIYAQGNLGTAGLLFVTGNIGTSNTISGFNIIASGTVTGAYLVGDGSQITNLPASNYNNTNVATFLANLGSNVVNTTGNIVGANILGSNLRTTGLISATGDITGGNVNAGASIVATSHTGATFSATGNVTSGNINTGGIVTATGNVTGGNLRTVGQVTATGNITGSFFVGNGSLLTGLPATYSNSNVQAYLPTYSGNVSNITAVGNITVVNGIFSGNGSGLTGVVAAGNVGSASQLANGTSSFNIPTADGIVVGNIGGVTNVYQFASTGLSVAGIVSATGNITGGNLSGTSIAGTLTTAAQAAITSVGTLTNISTSGNANVTSDVNSARVSATGNITGGNLITGGVISAGGAITAPQAGSIIPFYFANTAVFPSAATYHGALAHSHADGKMYFAHASNWVELVDVSSTQTLTNKTVSGVSATMTANVSGGNIVTAGQVSATGNITGNFFVGNGSLLTGIAAGGYGNANVAANLAAFGSNPILTTGNVTAGNFIGNVVGGGAGTPTISSATNLDLSAVSAVRVIGGGTFRLPGLTTAQIANTIAANGDMIYNSSVNKFQGYENGAWANII